MRWNKITKLKNEEGSWIEGSPIDDHVVHYFQSLFSTSADRGSVDFLSMLGNKVATEMNSELSWDFTTEEVFHALKQMNPHKTLRPDGLTPLFYQLFWHIVGASVT